MFKFPEGLYTDVRIEEVFESEVTVRNGELRENKQRNYRGAFIRIFDGNRWYYSSVTAVDKLDEEIQKLAEMATPNDAVYEHPMIQRLEVNQEELIKYTERSLKDVPNEAWKNLVWSYVEVPKQYEEVKEYQTYAVINKVIKSFYSSKGAKIKYDKQFCSAGLFFTLNVDGKRFDEYYIKRGVYFEDVEHLEEGMHKQIQKGIAYVKEATPVKPGKYTVIFAPSGTGVFTHESFGHKSEADLMLGSEAMKEEWMIGKDVGAPELSIVDRGDEEGRAWVPFDDEGNRCHKTYLIKDGKLAGRLHSAATAAELGEEVTGNARAMNFEYEPIVRMTTTYIEEGNQTKEELIEGVEEGIYVADIMHGSGMTAFTIAPSRAYMIRNGKIAEPVTVSVVTGNVMEALYQIDGISNKVEIYGGGCGKMEQMPLVVGMGGPYIRVKNLDVQ